MKNIKGKGTTMEKSVPNASTCEYEVGGSHGIYRGLGAHNLRRIS